MIVFILVVSVRGDEGKKESEKSLEEMKFSRMYLTFFGKFSLSHPSAR
jgi:hypothetical protein